MGETLVTSNPVLVEATRGGSVESVHRGAFIVMDAEGRTVIEGGDAHRPVFPRSAVKLIQALPLIESGAADAYGFDNKALALACGSHSSEPDHVSLAGAMLSAAGLNPAHLECGAHWPLFRRDDLIAFAREGGEPTPLHNNCSGKHAGLLCTCAYEGVEPNGYISPDHAAASTMRDALQEVTGYPHGPDNMGVDGCGLPNWAVPLRHLAHAYARLGMGHGLDPSRAKAASRLLAATMAEPWFVAGTKRFDTVLMEAAPHKVHVKTGAEGVYCASVPGEGIGIALKIDDGATRAAEIAVAALVGRFLADDAGERIAAMSRKTLRNWEGTEVGELRATEVLVS